jgi:nitric oxide reductase NorE protein
MARLRSLDPVPCHLPGEAGIWILIVGDLVLFSLLFVLFLLHRADDRSLFIASRALLNGRLGLLNTVLLLSSSWLVAISVRAARDQSMRRAHRTRTPTIALGLAMLCGIGFVIVKYFEYSGKIAAGLTPETNTFFMFYFVYTGIHLIHVLIGIGLLAVLAHVARDGNFSTIKLQYLESGACFWHLVDLLWIVLFTLFYLLAF